MKYSFPYGMSSVIDKVSELPKHASRTWSIRSLSQIKGLVVHQSAGPGSLLSIAKYHVSPGNHISSLGCPGICYSFAITPDGSIILCNKLEHVVWSQNYKERSGNENIDFASVLVVGDFSGPGHYSNQYPTSEQIKSLITLWGEFKLKLDLDDGDIYGHYNFGKPACPGTVLQGVVESIRNQRQIRFDADHDVELLLAKLGYLSQENVDDNWSLHDKKALISLQTDVGTYADGIFGPLTEAAIKRYFKLMGG